MMSKFLKGIRCLVFGVFLVLVISSVSAHIAIENQNVVPGIPGTRNGELSLDLVSLHPTHIQEGNLSCHIYEGAAEGDKVLGEDNSNYIKFRLAVGERQSFRFVVKSDVEGNKHIGCSLTYNPIRIVNGTKQYYSMTDNWLNYSDIYYNAIFDAYVPFVSGTPTSPKEVASDSKRIKSEVEPSHTETIASQMPNKRSRYNFAPIVWAASVMIILIVLSVYVTSRKVNPTEKNDKIKEKVKKPEETKKPSSGGFRTVQKHVNTMLTQRTLTVNEPPTCPHCGARFEADDTFCPDCGAKLLLPK